MLFSFVNTRKYFLGPVKLWFFVTPPPRLGALTLKCPGVSKVLSIAKGVIQEQQQGGHLESGFGGFPTPLLRPAPTSPPRLWWGRGATITILEGKLGCRKKFVLPSTPLTLPIPKFSIFIQLFLKKLKKRLFLQNVFQN